MNDYKIVFLTHEGKGIEYFHLCNSESEALDLFAMCHPKYKVLSIEKIIYE